jgi:hypothetical protein
MAELLGILEANATSCRRRGHPTQSAGAESATDIFTLSPPQMVATDRFGKNAKKLGPRR